MKHLLEKLDRIAGRWQDTLDDQLQQPILQVITGEVFTHGESVKQPIQQIVKQPVALTVKPTRASKKTHSDANCLPERALSEA